MPCHIGDYRTVSSRQQDVLILFGVLAPCTSCIPRPLLALEKHSWREPLLEASSLHTVPTFPSASKTEVWDTCHQTVQETTLEAKK